MKNFTLTLLVMLSFTLFQGCDKETERMEDFLAEFATVIKQGDSYRFELDNGKILTPVDIKDYSGSDGERVIIYWTPIYGDSVKINHILPIFSGGVLIEGFPERYINDPLKITSVWVEGEYLNLILEVEYHNTPHSFALFKDTSVTGTDLYLAHSNNNDQPGYPQTMYASFNLKTLRSQNGAAVPFRLFINTNKGLQQFNFLIGAR